MAVPRLVADHRPECAVRWRRPGAPAGPPLLAPPEGRRPLFLEEPRLLRVQPDEDGGPLALRSGRRRGPLRVLTGPERIESGWWSGRDVRRRYYEVETTGADRWWIFRDEATGAWYRHGVFG
ncbi:MAG: hypothetical protein R3F20_17740 [Planctomycetota bacterium]